MKPREIILSTGTKIFLGKNSENNDELVGLFKGKENTILHTVEPGSPFCVIEKINPRKEEIYEAGKLCASKSQDWRDNKRDIKMHVFTGNSVKKSFWMKSGSWKLNGKPNEITIKKKDILTILKP
ncbi:MAG: NFACT RNA binding domain-containing protein [Nanoarchaeota archaeon]|nr:NFACT RNA binding domain-containing protein [Nanoarchaeota archaeon]